MKSIHHIFLLLLFTTCLLSSFTFAAENEEIPGWEKKLLISVEKSMSNLTHKKINKTYDVVSFTKKGLELRLGGLVETEDAYEVINVYKNDKLLVTIISADDGGYQISIFGNPQGNKTVPTINAIDKEGDGFYDTLSFHTYDKDGNDLKSFYDENYDGYPESIIDYQGKKAFVRIENEMKQLVKKDRARYVEINGKLVQVEKIGSAWKLVAE